MEKRFDVTALGELLIDFTPYGDGGLTPPVFQSNPGGAPANMLNSVVKHGGKCSFIGKVGNDDFGHFLKDTLIESNICCENLLFDDYTRTTLAFVNLDKNGNRSFNFFRNPGADIMLKKEEIDESQISNSKIFHFGSLSLTDEPVRSATRYALEIAKENKVKISYDPNLRLDLWKSKDEAKNIITEYIYYADILKISEEEFDFLLGHDDFMKGSLEMYEKYNISYIFITLGEKGAFFRNKNTTGIVSTYDVEVIDTTGAGDAFTGSILKSLCDLSDSEFENLSNDELIDIVKLANASGALTATKKGGIPAIPNLKEAEKCVKNAKLL